MSDEARTRSPVKPGDVVGGKYRVERIIGAGGMGVVVSAVHTELDQSVALKFILPESITGKDAVERFMREARSVAKLKSEHVARVFDVGRDDNDNPYMVLELLEGMDLAKLNKQKGPLTVADSVEYVLQACEALVEAHAAGIVHRDLKPQNLFVGRRLNGLPLVKVLDFGIAKAIGAAAVGQMALTDSQAVMGSPLYMAPEHMRSARAADVRSDIWSLGVILYELLGGQLPFDGETVTEVCIRVVNEAPPSLSTLRPGLDQPLVAIVMRCLEKDPSLRWQNVAQFATALEPYSKSAKQGAQLRPWRSFEDTLDPSSATNVPAIRPADDTGPSTAITMPTNEDIAKLRAPTPLQPNLQHVQPMSMPTPQPHLVSTDVTWGEGTDRRHQIMAPQQQTPRSFATGIFVGVMIAVAAVVVVIVVAFRSAHSTAPPTVVAAASASAQIPAIESPPPADSIMVATTPSALPNASASTVVATSQAPVKSHPPFMPSGRVRQPASPSATSALQTPAQTPPQQPAPNGAPILR